MKETSILVEIYTVILKNNYAFIREICELEMNY